jgi:hypothetical protein
VLGQGPTSPDDLVVRVGVAKDHLGCWAGCDFGVLGGRAILVWRQGEHAGQPASLRFDCRVRYSLAQLRRHSHTRSELDLRRSIAFALSWTLIAVCTHDNGARPSIEAMSSQAATASAGASSNTSVWSIPRSSNFKSSSVHGLIGVEVGAVGSGGAANRIQSAWLAEAVAGERATDSSSSLEVSSG